jgi:hypothetical protein
MISLMLPPQQQYDLRGLLGLLVVLWAKYEASPWVRELGPQVRQARPISCVVLFPPHGLSEIPLAAPAEQEIPFPALKKPETPPIPWWEVED